MPPRTRAWPRRASGRPAPGDAEHEAAGEAAVGVLLAVLDGYRIEGTDAIDAIRFLRVVMHGFVTLEAAGGFGLPQSVDGTFTRIIDSVDAALAGWAPEPAG